MTSTQAVHENASVVRTLFDLFVYEIFAYRIRAFGTLVVALVLSSPSCTALSRYQLINEHSPPIPRFCKLWDTETGECISRFSSRKVPYCVKFNPDEDKQHLFVCGTSDKKILCWDTRSGEIVQEYDRHLGRFFVSCLSVFSLSGFLFACPVVCPTFCYFVYLVGALRLVFMIVSFCFPLHFRRRQHHYFHRQQPSFCLHFGRQKSARVGMGHSGGLQVSGRSFYALHALHCYVSQSGGHYGPK